MSSESPGTSRRCSRRPRLRPGTRRSCRPSGPGSLRSGRRRRAEDKRFILGAVGDLLRDLFAVILLEGEDGDLGAGDSIGRARASAFLQGPCRAGSERSRGPCSCRRSPGRRLRRPGRPLHGRRRRRSLLGEFEEGFERRHLPLRPRPRASPYSASISLRNSAICDEFQSCPRAALLQDSLRAGRSEISKRTVAPLGTSRSAGGSIRRHQRADDQHCTYRQPIAPWRRPG